MSKKQYMTLDQSLKEISKLNFESEEAFKKFMEPRNNDISINDIDAETFEMVAKYDPFLKEE